MIWPTLLHVVTSISQFLREITWGCTSPLLSVHTLMLWALVGLRFHLLFVPARDIFGITVYLERLLESFPQDCTNLRRKMMLRITCYKESWQTGRGLDQSPLNENFLSFHWWIMFTINILVCMHHHYKHFLHRTPPKAVETSTGNSYHKKQQNPSSSFSPSLGEELHCDKIQAKHAFALPFINFLIKAILQARSQSQKETETIQHQGQTRGKLPDKLDGGMRPKAWAQRGTVEAISLDSHRGGKEFTNELPMQWEKWASARLHGRYLKGGKIFPSRD